ncbi:MAG: DUF177 domain-containing protein [Alistipes sp.]|nr:DUF177 domain-containing protein [Alistipes sp.]
MKRYVIDAQTVQQSDFEFELQVGMELFEAMEMTEISAVDFKLSVSGHKEASNRSVIELTGTGTVVTPCDRCLDDVTLEVEVEAEMMVLFGDEAKAFDGEEETLQRGDELNIAQFVYDSIMLALPMIRAHKEGECNPDMIARISGVTE